MKTRLLLLLPLVALMTVSCQGDNEPSLWTRVFGDEGETEYVTSVQAASEGGFLVLGTACRDSDAGADRQCRTYLLRTDAGGNELWNVTIEEQSPFAITFPGFETADEGFLVFRATRTTEKLYDVIAIKADRKGNRLWSKTIETDIRLDVSVTRAAGDGFIISGVPLAEAGIEIIEVDAEGEVLQRRTFDLAMDDPNSSDFVVNGMSDGGFAVAWRELEGEFNTDIHIARMDEDGRELWSRTLGEAGTAERPGQLIETPDGGIAVLGATGPLGDPFRKNWDIYFARLEADGGRLWEAAYGGRSISESPRSVVQTEDGGFVIAGGSGPSHPGPWHTYLIRIDEHGDEMWSRTFEGDDKRTSGASSILQTPDRGFIVAGEVSWRLPDGTMDRGIFLMKMDSEGNYQPLR